MALTRIKENQITDLAVTTAKIANNAITAGKLANNITYGSDLTVSGNLTVSGTTVSVSTTNTRVDDAILSLAASTAGSPSEDAGILINRGSSDNYAFLWDESADQFVLANVGSEDGDTAGNVTISAYANAQLGTLTYATLNDGSNDITSTAAEINLIDGSTAGTIVNSKAVIYGASGEVNATTLQIAGSSITSTAAELNFNDGATAGTVVNSKTVVYGASGEVNATTLQIGGSSITATAAELNALDGITADVNELNILDGVTSTAAELNLVDGSVAGTIVNSKAVIYGASGEVNATTLQVGGVSITSTPAELNILDGATLDVNELNILDGVTSTTAELNLVDGSAAGTIVNSKAVIYGAAGEVNATTLQVGGVAITSTPAELNILDGATLDVNELNLLDGVTASTSELNILDGVTSTAAEINLLDGAVAGTIANGVAVVYGAAGEVNATTLQIGGNSITSTAAELNVLDGITATTAELNFTDGVTSNIQTQLDAKLALAGGTMSGNIAMGTNSITGMADPSSAQDAATKAYVDSQVSSGSALDIAGDSGTDTVTVGTDTFTFSGTANEVTTAVTDNTLTIGLASDVSINNDLTVGGNLTVSGTTTTLSTTNSVVSDSLIELNSGAASNANDLGLIFERGSTGDNAVFAWDESADKFTLGTTTATGASTGDLTISTGTLVADLEGNASTATSLETARDIALSGDVTGSASFDGTGNISITATIAADSVALGTDTTGNYVESITGGNGITAGAAAEGGTPTVAIDLTDTNIFASDGTVSRAVVLDGSGNFSAGNITADLTGDVTGSLTGNADTASALSSAVTVALSGDVTGSATFTSAGDTATIAATIAANSVALGTDTTGNYVATIADAGNSAITVANSGTESAAVTLDITDNGVALGTKTTGNYVATITGGNGISSTGATTGETIDHTLSVDLTDTNIFASDGTVSRAVVLDGSGDFTANVITADIDGIVGGNTPAAGTFTTLTANTSATLASAAVSDLTSGRVVLAGTSGELEDNGNLTFNGSTLAVTGSITASSNVDIADAGSLRVGTGNDFTINHDGTNTTITNGTGILAIDGLATSSIRINEAGANVDTVIEGDTNASLVVVDASGDNVGIGGAPNANAVFHVNDTGAMILPAGTTAQRPGTAVSGMFRYNNQTNTVEYYDNDSWATITSDFTVATSQTFNGDDSTTAFTLSALTGGDTYNVAGVLVMLNGIVQEPTTVYGVSGTTLTFTTAPATGDLIEVRKFTTTTTINALADVDGDTQIQVEETADEDIIRFDIAGSEKMTLNATQLSVTGNIVATGNITANGDITLGDADTDSVTFNADVASHLIPDADDTYDLGSASKKWRDLYLSGSSLYLGNLVLKDNGSNVMGVFQSDGTTSASISGAITGNADTATALETARTIAGNSFDGTANITIASTDLSDTADLARLASPAFTGTATGVNLTLSGDLTVNGTTTTLATTNTTITDNLIELNNGAASNANDSGIVIERGSTGDNAFMGWDESADKFVVGTTTATGASTGDLTVTTGTLVANIEGNVTGNLTGDVTGNADTATALASARTIGGVSFDGTANINLPGVNTTGNQDTSGNAATATALATARTIGGVSFNGTANINLPGVNTTGNQNTSGNAATATLASTVTITANNTLNETVYLTFVDGATGTQGLETDTGLSYNPSTNVLSTTASAARYADLAEMYAADEAIEPGTVVHFAGDGKVAACDVANCRAVAGIISTDPAHLMNSDQEGVALALAGRVPCKVTGPVAAGDLMVSAGNGMAMANNEAALGTVIGKAIEANADGEGVIEVLALMM